MLVIYTDFYIIIYWNFLLCSLIIYQNSFEMDRLKTTYWLLIIIGLLTFAAAIYLYSKGKPFDTYFLSGAMGLVFAATGFSYLRKMKKEE